MTYLEGIEQKLVQIQNAFINCDSSQFATLQSQLNQLLGQRDGYNRKSKEVDEEKEDLKTTDKKK